MATDTLHLAYSCLDDDGVSRDVSLLLDGDEHGDLGATKLLRDKLTAFFHRTGLLTLSETVEIIG